MKVSGTIKIIAVLLLIVLPDLAANAARSEAPLAPFTVSKAVPLNALSESFIKTSGWTGSDAAYTIPLSSRRTLWLFGDTWIGKIKNGKRLRNASMINNSAAWQSTQDSSFKYFWRQVEGKPVSLVSPQEKTRWYWPLDGALIDGRLYLFMNVLKKNTSRKAFQFVGCQLAVNRPQV